MAILNSNKEFFERVLTKYKYLTQAKRYLIMCGFSNVSKESVFKDPLLNAFAVNYLKKLEHNDVIGELINDLERPFFGLIKEQEKRERVQKLIQYQEEKL
jgi:hypothetical protein